MTETEQLKNFEEWLDQHRGIILKIVRVYATSAMDREDIFQDICIQLWRSVPSFHGKSATSTWVYRIALNVSIKWVRKKTNQERNNFIDFNEIESSVTDDRISWLHAQVASLNAVDKSVALLLLDGFSYKEIASIAGISESLVGVKINRIKNQLIEKSKNYNSNGI